MTGNITHRPTRGVGLSDRWDEATRQITACAGKEVYASPAEARRVIVRRLARSKRGNRKHTNAALGMLNVYRCEFCHQWHIGRRARR